MNRFVPLPSSRYARGIGENKRGMEPVWHMASCDIETVRKTAKDPVTGKRGPVLEPFSLQFALERDWAHFFRVDTACILDTFLEVVAGWAKRGVCNVVWFHNLSFDFQALCYAHKGWFLDLDVNFTVTHAGTTMKAWTQGTWFVDLTLKDGRRVHLRDTKAYIEDTLEGAGRICAPDLPKLPRPECIQRVPTAQEYPYFREYAERDAVVAHRIGEVLEGFHKRYDIRLTVSLAQAAIRIFRHRFIPKGLRIPLPKTPVLRASEAAFHGPKIRRYVPMGWYKDTYELDLNGAYAWAESLLPSPFNGRYRLVEDHRGHVPFPAGAHGVACISGTVRDNERGLLLSLSGKPLHGRVQEVWVTTYELDEALKAGMATLTDCAAYLYESSDDRRPFADFANHCWDARSAAKPGTFDRLAYKLLPNALWGKLWTCRSGETMVTRNAKDDTMAVRTKRQMTYSYHPFFAALIPGRVRARMFALEQKYNAMTVSTDAIRTQTPPDPADLGTALGTLKVACFGDCLILNDRLVRHNDATGGAPHYTYHGFVRDPEQFMAVAAKRLAGKKVTFVRQRMYTIRQAARMRDKSILPLEVRHERVEMGA